MKNIKVTIWNEYRHERLDEEIRKVYPKGIHTAIASHLKTFDELEVSHEAFPVYYNPNILRVIKNAVLWATPIETPQSIYGNTQPITLI